MEIGTIIALVLAGIAIFGTAWKVIVDRYTVREINILQNNEQNVLIKELQTNVDSLQKDMEEMKTELKEAKHFTTDVEHKLLGKIDFQFQQMDKKIDKLYDKVLELLQKGK